MSEAYSKALTHYAGIGFVIGLPVAAILNHFLPIEGFSLGGFILLLLLTMIVTVVVSLSVIGQLAERIGTQEAARSRAVPLRGAVVDVQPTSTSKRGEWLDVTVSLDVPLPGGEQHVKTDNWRIKAIDAPRLPAGQSVPVKIDPQRPQFVFPDRMWIEML